VQGREEQRCRQQTDDGLEKSAEERLLGQARDRCDRQTIGQSPSAEGLGKPGFEALHGWCGANEPQGERQACADPDCYDEALEKMGEVTAWREGEDGPVATKEESDQGDKREHTLLVCDQAGRYGRGSLL
jgi:hypothetical protein